MTKAKHTQSPWRQHGPFVSADDGTEIFTGMGRSPDGGLLPMHEAIANAKVSAAAPDLLSALEAMGALPEGYCFCFNTSRDARRPEHTHTGECQAARAAIAKATEQNENETKGET